MELSAGEAKLGLEGGEDDACVVNFQVDDQELLPTLLDALTLQ